MKKLRTILVIIISLFLFVGTALAESSNINIVFKVGDETLKINEKDVKVTKPFVVNGVTLVPLRVITEAFGAEVIWNGDERNATLNYGEKQIKLFIDSKRALVDGQETTLLEAPVIVDGITMVPLRFITENFGADVKYDDNTQQIIVEKKIAGDKSIKDFALILKKTTKTKVGDSYYQWTMNFPKGLKINDRNFNGTNTRFAADDDSYRITISIWNNEGETLDTLMTETRENYDFYTLVSQNKLTKEGLEYVKTVVKGTSVYDIRQYIKNNKVYEVELYAKDYDKYKDTTTYTGILDSFITSFTKDGSIEDLSDINGEGYRTYSDKNLKFTINILPDWYQNRNDNQPNTIEFNESDSEEDKIGDNIYVNMFSLEDGFTLEGWVKKDLKELEDTLNPEYYQILQQEDVTINGVNAKKLLYILKIANKSLYVADIFLAGKNYKYSISYLIKSDTYNNQDKLAKIEQSLNSFIFTEPDPNKVGTMMSPKDVDVSDTKVKKQNAALKWSLELPATWTADFENNDKDQVLYNDSDSKIAFQMLVIKDANTENYLSYFEEELTKKLKLGNMKLEKKESVFEKGTTVNKYRILHTVDELDVYQYTYVLSKNGYLYMINLICAVNFLSEKNNNTMQAIWQSLNFE